MGARRCSAELYRGKWQDVGTAERLRRAGCPAGVESANGGIQGHPHPRSSRAAGQRRKIHDASGVHRDQGWHQVRRRRGFAGAAERSAAAGARKPAWLRAPLAGGAGYAAVKGIVREHRLSTVCEEAKCPNIGECWNAGTATIMLMGAVCTRACRFCAVDTGNPRGWLDAEEPENVARSVALMGLKYVVLTSVDRDDLAGRRRGALRRGDPRDQAAQSGNRRRGADAGFRGVVRDVHTVMDSGLEVFAQNVETVRAPDASGA